jgi:uncharacterized membrane protein
MKFTGTNSHDMADLFFFPAYTFFVLREKGGGGMWKGKREGKRKEEKGREKKETCW